ncbi:MAG: heme-binding domain-containing protein [Acidobacteria bacterium]|nr:heme-binding domain-containing protein [Acidobacteriota bacterium]
MKRNLLLAVAAIFILLQYFPATPAKSNPPTDPARTFAATMKPPEAVHAILRRACFDCHSHETVWPWYADVAPISWAVRNHVMDGRKHLNFSEWLKPGERVFSSWSDLEDVCKAVREKSMPLAGYDWVHGRAKLSNAERQAVCRWTDATIAAAK